VVIPVPASAIKINAYCVGNHIYLCLATRNNYEIRVLDSERRRRCGVALRDIFLCRIFLRVLLLRILFLLVLLLRVLFLRRHRLSRLNRFNNYCRCRRRYYYGRGHRYRYVDIYAECKTGCGHACQKYQS
jgi:hypothetical protein